MHLVDFEKITIEFKCQECGYKVKVDLKTILDNGKPWCGNHGEYEVLGSTAAIPEK
ncbi:MAG: hypothetical protein HOG49_32930 [Candidatus Scalindua sp.]|jgi:hypothetical protein|nr:hypothetical protein [Candidatus Scalindua sp.]